jgi:hypothetical protein
MDAASWKPSEDRARQRSSLERAKHLRVGVRAIRLIKGIALILIVAVAIGLLICATLALVGLNCPVRGVSHGWV